MLEEYLSCKLKPYFKQLFIDLHYVFDRDDLAVLRALESTIEYVSSVYTAISRLSIFYRFHFIV